jgi:hypothetical protein
LFNEKDLDDAFSDVNLEQANSSIPTKAISEESITRTSFCREYSAIHNNGLKPKIFRSSVKLISTPLKDEPDTKAFKQSRKRRVSFSDKAQIITEDEIISGRQEMTDRISISSNTKLKTPRDLISQPEIKESQVPKKTAWRGAKSFCSNVLRKIGLKNPKEISNQDSDPKIR